MTKLSHLMQGCCNVSFVSLEATLIVMGQGLLSSAR